jgi:hypothetical protein
VTDSIVPASQGAGPLLQRDYWAALAGCPLSPQGVMAHVKAHFCELPPRELVEFVAPGGLGCDAELDIAIKPAQQCRVRVVHEDPQSLTLGTLEGHPEAGRITFGAYRNPQDAVIFHIRSRARSSTTAKLLGFLAIGEALQTNTWTDFINNLAGSLGLRIDGPIHADTARVDELPEDCTPATAPTFIAAGG